MKLEAVGCVSVDQFDHQRTVFNPDPKYCFAGYIISHPKSTSARKRLALHCQKIIYVNVNVYAQIINSEERMEMVKDYNIMDADIVGETE